jgi:hypothetical protein
MVIKRSLGDEIYWFNWTTECSSEGSATIQVARLGDEAMFSRVYKPSTFGKARRNRGVLYEIGVEVGRGCGGCCGFLDARSAEPESRSDSPWQ